MKLNKIFAIAVALLAFSACSDDDDVDYNTNGNVSVAMKDAAISVEENVDGGFLNVPIEVKGTANGMIKVDVAIAATGSESAQEDKHFYVTGKTIFIPANQQEGYVEIAIVDDRFRNSDHSFNVTITSAEGATVSGQKSTKVTIVDNDHTLYGRLQGKWRMNGMDGFTDEPLRERYCTITGAKNPDDEGYGDILFFSFTDDEDCAIQLEAHLTTIDGYNVIRFDIPQWAGKYGPYELNLYGSDGSGIYGGALLAIVNEDESALEWASELDFAICAQAGSQVLGFWDYYYNLVWDRD